MGIISYDGTLEMFKGDMKVFNIIKVRDDWNCGKCKAKIIKGNYCWGTNYQKFCLNCGYEVTNKIIEDLGMFLKSLKIRVKDLEMEKEKYATSNIVGNL